MEKPYWIDGILIILLILKSMQEWRCGTLWFVSLPITNGDEAKEVVKPVHL